MVKTDEVSLISVSEQELLTLYSVNINATVVGKFADLEVTHSYINTSQTSKDTMFVIPRGIYQIFQGLEVTMNNKSYVAYIAEKKVIESDFNQKVNKGITAVCAESIGIIDDKSTQNDLVLIKIGNIPPYEKIDIKFSIVQILDIYNGKDYKFSLLPALFPKCSSSEDIVKSLNRNLKIKDKLKLEYNNCLAYPTTISINISSEQIINNVEIFPKENKSYFTIMKENDTCISIIKEPSKPFYFKNKFEFTYSIDEKELKKPNLSLYKHPNFPNDYALYFSFCPLYYCNNSDELIQDNIINIDNIHFVFLLDRSGSMYGGRIAKAKESLIFFLKSLPMNSKFNVISFGNSYSPLFDSFMETNDTNISEAINKVETFNADMGGTIPEIALEYLSQQIPSSSNILIRAVFITDGHVFYIDKVLEQINQCMKGSNFRFDCLGIGRKCSNDYLKRIADKGNGEAVFCRDNQDLTEKVIDILEKSLSCYVKSCNVQYKNKRSFLQGNSKPIIQSTLKSTNSLNSLIEYIAILPKKIEDHNLTFIYEIIQGNYPQKYKFDFNLQTYIENAIENDLFHKIAVWSYINEQDRKCSIAGTALPNEENNKQKDLSLKYNVFTKYTGLIWVPQGNNLTKEERQRKMQESVQRKQNPIPLHIKLLSGETKGVIADLFDYVGDIIKKVLPISCVHNVAIKFFNRFLDPKKTLFNYQIQPDSTLHLCGILPGGGNIEKQIFINVNGQSTNLLINIDANQTKIAFPFIIDSAVKLVNINKENYDFFFENENITNNTNSYTFNSNNGNYTLDIFSRNLGNKIGVSLVKSQLMNGLWVVNENNLKLIGLNLQKFKTLKQQLKINPFNKYNKDDCLFTVLVIAWIRFYCKNEIKRFSLIIRKSQKMLNNVYGKEYNEDIQQVVEFHLQTNYFRN